MKRFLCLIFTIAFVFTLCSCDQIPSVTQTQSQDLPSADELEKLKIFSDFISDNLHIYDDGKLSFLHLAKSLKYNDPAIEDSLSDQKNSTIADSFSLLQDKSSTGESLSIKNRPTADHFMISEEYNSYDDGRVINSAYFYITEYVSGMSLPFGLTFDVDIDEALKILTGVDVSFKPDENSDTDMTLYSNNNESIVYCNLNAIKAPIDYLNPYRIVYTNKYIYTNKIGFVTERTEKISLNFDTFNNTLREVIIEIEDSYNIPVSQIPQTTLIPTTTPTPTLTPTSNTDPEILPKIAVGKRFETGTFSRIETWPMEDNGIWNARAFCDIIFNLNASDGDFSQKENTDSYKYNFQLYYCKASDEATPDSKLIGPFTLKINTVQLNESDSSYEYRLSLADCPEGDPFEYFEIGERYCLLLTVNEKDNQVGYSYKYFTYLDIYSKHRDIFTEFWKSRDRNKGYTSNTYPLTDNDRVYSNEKLMGILKFGGPYVSISDNLLTSTAFYNIAFETWPYLDNQTWCSRAFFHTNIVIDSITDRDFTENLGKSDYEYTWEIHFFNSEKENELFMHGPYVVNPYSFYRFSNGNIMYRLNLGDSLSGDFTKNFEVGETYSFFIYIRKGDEIMGVAYLYVVWTQQLADNRSLYYAYWERHDRSLGIKTGMHPLTEDDVKDALLFNFDENGKYLTN